MAATIALCVFTSAWIFGQIEPYVAEVTGYDEPTAVPQVAAASNNGDQGGVESQNAQDSGAEAAPTQASGQPTLAPSNPTEDTPAFQPTHRSNPDFTINFRPGPSVSSGDPLDSLVPGTPLQYLEEEALDEEGVIWLKMQTESGLVGWLREVDTEVIIQ